jgi:adenine-specific DNA-methyltransferase
MSDERPQGIPTLRRPRGQLELTWAEKDWRLITRSDGETASDGEKYGWVPPSDHRVAEVRLLHDAGCVGGGGRGLLVRGDALHALRSLGQLEPFRSELVGKVKLAYLDPPFNTGQAFEVYDDGLEHSIWLTMMRDRLEQVKLLLSPAGSVWVHCDDYEQAYLKVMMDEVFGRENFVADVIWEKADSPRMDARGFSVRHDHIVVFRSSPEWEPNRLSMDPEEMKHFDKEDDDGNRYRRVLLRKWGKNSLRSDRPNLFYSLAAPDGSDVMPIRSDGKEGCWRWSRTRYAEREDEVEWVEGKDGWQPYVRQMARDAVARPPETLWTYDDVGSNRQGKAEVKAFTKGGEPFETPKPEGLIFRILEIGSQPGDLVLDCFLGSGTTAAVAHKMQRAWVGVERSRDNLDRFVVPRLTKVISGEDSGGVTEAAGWAGGDGFQIVDVGASMFEDDDGDVVLAEWATNGKLARATAAQLHFVPEDDPPFCARKGNHRLAVVDGLISEDVVDLLLARLDEDEQITLCGTSIDPAAVEKLKSERAGSRVKKIPASLLADYQESGRWKAGAGRANLAQNSEAPSSSLESVV